MTMLKYQGDKRSGFSLIEILITIAIVAILVALALPNYQDSVRKSRRADAQVDLMEFANTAERVFTQTNSYATVTLPANTDFYTYTFTVVPTATAWTIQAAPKTGQDKDPCGTMTLMHTGQRTKTGTMADCW